MKIYGYFKDLNNNTVTVNIYNINKTGADININTCDWIEFADDPVDISTDCDDSFVHIIKKTCKIQLKSQRWLGEYLFANNATSIVVNVKRTINNVTTCLFAGFVTPCSYNQDYANAWETITINCIDNLGVMEYRNQNDEKTWTQLKAESKMRTFKELLDRMKLRDTTMIIDNMPETNAQMLEAWVETGYERQTDNNGNITYYAVETRVKELDANTAVTTTETRLGRQLTPDYRPSEDTVVDNGTVYYKDYAWVEVNGTYVKTDDWILGDPVTTGIPTVTGTQRVLDGWSYGAHLVPFEYYEHFRLDYVMSDGSVKYGANDTIGDRIPEAPSTTTLGSYYEMREAGTDDLDYDDTTGFYYYKNYAWIIMNFGLQMHLYETGDWVRGRIYGNISGKMVANPTNNGLLPDLVMGNNTSGLSRTYTPEVDSTTAEFYYNVEYDPTFNYMYFEEPNGNACFENVEELYFNDVDTSNFIYIGKYNDTPSWMGAVYYQVYGLLLDFISLVKVKFNNFNTSNVTYFDSFFLNCNNLTTLDLTHFNTSSSLGFRWTFNGCSSLTTLDLSSFDTSAGTSMDYMFYNCSSLTSLDLSNFDTSAVTNMNAMFAGCSSLTTLDLSNFDTSACRKFTAIFSGCSNLTTLNLSNWDVYRGGLHPGGNVVLPTERMFNGCTNLTTLILNNISNTTFNNITEKDLTLLPTTVTIYRDDDVYEYDDNTNTWVITNNAD